MVCQGVNKKTETGLVLGAATGVPTALYIIADGGVEDIATALLAGAVVGGFTWGFYTLYQCDFNLLECSSSGALSLGCGLLGTLGIK